MYEIISLTEQKHTIYGWKQDIYEYNIKNHVNKNHLQTFANIFKHFQNYFSSVFFNVNFVKIGAMI